MDSAIRIPPELAALQEFLVARLREAIPHVLAVYAYGSRVTNTAGRESDLDVAILLPIEHAVPQWRLLQLCGDLEVMTGYPVQVSILDVNRFLVHCKEVVGGGVRLYVADAHAVAEFEMQTLSNYARLCEDRKPVVKAYMMEPVDE
jgi:predicted nucleotidyltransferase